MYNILKENKINFDFILKLHTKNEVLWKNFLINGLLKNNINNLINHMEEKYRNMIGSYRWYKKIMENPDNNFDILSLNYNNNIINNSYFIGGTIFLCKNNI